MTLQRLSVLKHNVDMTRGRDQLAQVNHQDGDPLYTCIHTNHFVHICRCFLQRVKTTEANIKLGIADSEGRLSMALLKNVSPMFHDYIDRGHKVIVLRADIRDKPKFMSCIQTSRNLDNVMQETEMQLFMRATNLLRDGTSKKKVVKVLQKDMAHLYHYVEPVVTFAATKFADPDAPFMADLMVSPPTDSRIQVRT